MDYTFMDNYEAATAFLTQWWQGMEMPRPPLQIRIAQDVDAGQLMPLPQIEDVFCPRYTTKSMVYRLAYEYNRLRKARYFAEGMASAKPHIGVETLAIFLGGQPVESTHTVWLKPWVENIHQVEIQFHEDNPYWHFQWELVNRLVELGRGRFICEAADMLNGLDILATMTGPQQLIYDLMDYPDIVLQKAEEINTVFLRLYNRIIDVIRDRQGGNSYLWWAPGKMYRDQCDFAGNLSPELFRDFVVPGMKKVISGMDYVIYHWDGPGALCQLDILLEIEKINVLQWVPGVGNIPNYEKHWWPMYHRIFETGKKVQLVNIPCLDVLLPMKKEFGREITKFMINFFPELKTEKEAVEVIQALTVL